MKTLNLADGLNLPIAAVTEKLGWIGRTGSGKTYGAMKLAELMLEAGAQVGALDPVGVWRALRVPAGKEGRSFEVVVFGGLYGDLPLQPTAGALIADVVCDRGISFVLDVSQFIPSEQQRFARAFADRFFQRRKAAPAAVHLFLEECQEFISQNPMGDEALTLHAFQRLWKLGRNFGIGGSLISQRPQEISKKAFNMSGTLFAFQMTGPQERKAVREWVADHGVATDIESVLQKLKVGEPHVESPTFLQVSRSVRILPRVTADLSSTPEVGASKVAKRPLTPIDVQQLEAAMAETIEKARADDPKELRKLLQEKDRKIQSLEGKVIPAAAEKAVPALSDAELDLLRSVRDEFAQFKDYIADRADVALASIAERAKAEIDAAAAAWVGDVEKRRGLFLERLEKTRVQKVLDKIDRVVVPTKHPTDRPGQSRPLPAAQPGRASVATRQAARQAGAHVNGTATIKGGAFRSMLVALAQAERPLADNQVAARAGMALSGTFDKYLGQQRTNGWVDGPRSALAITDDGLLALGAYDPLPTGIDLQAYWLNYVGGGKKRQMLETLIAAYPSALSDEQVAERAEMALSGTFDKYLGQLRTLQLVTGTRSALKASQELFS